MTNYYVASKHDDADARGRAIATESVSGVHTTLALAAADAVGDIVVVVVVDLRGIISTETILNQQKISKN